MLKKDRCHFLKAPASDKNGISLVELLIVLLILNIILALGYMFYSFAMRSYNVGEARSNVQQNVRIASDYISRQLRYAFEVQILDSSFAIPTTVDSDDDFNYIFINENNAIEHRHKDGSYVIFGGESSGVETDYLEFEISEAEGGESILKYTISAISVGAVYQEYSLVSELFINNLSLLDNKIKNVDVTTGTAIRFISNPDAPASVLALPTVIESGSIATNLTFTLVLSFAKFNDGDLKPYTELDVAFDGFDFSITKIDAHTASLVIYNHKDSFGTGKITIKVGAFSNYDSPVETTVTVMPDD